MPLVSVIMSVFNGERFLKESIESILDQTMTDFEFIIINDGSTDNSERIILSYIDSRIIYLANDENVGLSESLNKAITFAKGKYVARMDADDISLPERFETQVTFMEKNPDIGVCGSWIQLFGGREGCLKYHLTHEEIKVGLLLGTPLVHSSTVIKREFFYNFKYSPEYKSSQDYELWTRSIDKYNFANVPKVLLRYRAHYQQTNRHEQIEDANKIRETFLNKAGCDFSLRELKEFNKFVSGKSIPFSELAFMFEKILKANKRSRYFDEGTLERILGKRFCAEWWKTLFMEPSNMANSFEIFKSSPFKKYMFQGFGYCSKRIIEEFIKKLKKHQG